MNNEKNILSSFILVTTFLIWTVHINVVYFFKFQILPAKVRKEVTTGYKQQMMRWMAIKLPRQNQLPQAHHRLTNHSKQQQQTHLDRMNNNNTTNNNVIINNNKHKNNNNIKKNNILTVVRIVDITIMLQTYAILSSLRNIIIIIIIIKIIIKIIIIYRPSIINLHLLWATDHQPTTPRPPSPQPALPNTMLFSPPLKWRLLQMLKWIPLVLDPL